MIGCANDTERLGLSGINALCALIYDLWSHCLLSYCQCRVANRFKIVNSKCCPVIDLLFGMQLPNLHPSCAKITGQS
jgi:hypothetical protein